jgi:hypothetical protein
MQPGDVILTGVKAQGWVSKLIKFGAWVGRYPAAARRFSHAAIVRDVRNDGTVILTEAIERGVVTRPFSYKEGDYVHIPMDLPAAEQEKVALFCASVVDAHAKYGFATFVACGINCILAHLRRAPIAFTIGNTKICSGLVADALAHAGYIWRKPVDVIMPADIWLELGEAA